MADDDLAALERAERDAWDARHWRPKGDDAALRDAWLTARRNLNRALALARGDG